MTEPSPLSPPPLIRQLLEARWPLEAAAFSTVPASCAVLRPGDGHPVLVLPGFTAGDASTIPLRWALRSRGYWVHAWRLGFNLGPTSHAVGGMRHRLEELSRTHGRRVTLVGWSLGGIYARHLARERPELVRQVITLGSPYRMVDGDRSAASPIWERLEHLHDGDMGIGDITERDRPPLTVPATSIYSRDDGVARWQTCIDETGPGAGNPRAENIEVYASHVGLGFNPAVVLAVLDRLAQPAGDWRPFRPPAIFRPWYPQPASWTDVHAQAA